MNRMMPAMNDIINTDQKGFMPNRKIQANIRKIFDVIKVASDSDTPALIFQADFSKAFDRVEMVAIQGALEFFGFSKYLQKWFHILYDNFFVRIQNNGCFSEKLHIQRSVHQGAPASAAIFVCIAELLAIAVRSDADISGVFIKDIEQLLNQYADDTDAALDGKDGTSLNTFLKHLDKFKKCTGCSLNYDKTTVYRIGSLKDSKAQYYTEKPLNWTADPINVLGITISNNIKEDAVVNYQKVISRAKCVLKQWSGRSLSLFGKIQVVNTLIASLFVYQMAVLPKMPENLIVELELVLEKFIWNGHKPKIPTKILSSPKAMGGRTS